LEEQSEIMSEISGTEIKAREVIQIDINELKDLDEKSKRNNQTDAAKIIAPKKKVKKWEKRWILIPNVY
jgi:hypothetical protein